MVVFPGPVHGLADWYARQNSQTGYNRSCSASSTVAGNLDDLPRRGTFPRAQDRLEQLFLVRRQLKVGPINDLAWPLDFPLPPLVVEVERPIRFLVIGVWNDAR